MSLFLLYLSLYELSSLRVGGVLDQCLEHGAGFRHWFLNEGFVVEGSCLELWPGAMCPVWLTPGSSVLRMSGFRAGHSTPWAKSGTHTWEGVGTTVIRDSPLRR